jgi:hypothetical protein
MRLRNLYPVIERIGNVSSLVLPWQGLRTMGVGVIDSENPSRTMSWSELESFVAQPMDVLSICYANLQKAKMVCRFQALDEGVWWVTPANATECPDRSLSSMMLIRELYEWATRALGRNEVSGLVTSIPRSDVFLIGTDRVRMQRWSSHFYRTSIGGSVSPVIIDVKPQYKLGVTVPYVGLHESVSTLDGTPSGGLACH